MGQFLATGLVTDIIVSQEEAEKAGFNFDQIRAALEKQMHFPSEIFELIPHNDYYKLQLKPELLHTQLLPFLKAFYPKLYSESKMYESVLTRLKETKPEEYIEWAETKPDECFQYDRYAMPETLGSYPDYLRVNFGTIMLALEGKIAMETYGKQFNFFKYCMAQSFKEFSISGALRVYITG